MGGTICTKRNWYMSSVPSLLLMSGKSHWGQLKCLTVNSLITTEKWPLKQSLHRESVHPGMLIICETEYTYVDTNNLGDRIRVGDTRIDRVTVGVMEKLLLPL